MSHASCRTSCLLDRNFSSTHNANKTHSIKSCTQSKSSTMVTPNGQTTIASYINAQRDNHREAEAQDHAKDLPLPWNLDHEPTPAHIITPFRYLTSPLPAHLQPFQGSFPQFSSLPPELQANVASQADAATAWQLMRTSSEMRRVARRRFWDNEGIYYHIFGSWWRSRFEGYKHVSDYQPRFWGSVTSIMLDAERYEWIFGREKVWNSGVTDPEEQMKRFWCEIVKSFPRVKRVLLDNYRIGESAMEGFVEQETGTWAIFRGFLDAAPKRIHVRMLINGGNFKYKFGGKLDGNCLVGSNQWRGWRFMRQREWQPEKIIEAPGICDLPEGPLKEYERFRHIDTVLHWEKHGHAELNIHWPAEIAAQAQAHLEMKQARVCALKMEHYQLWTNIFQLVKTYGSMEYRTFVQEFKAQVRRYLFPEQGRGRVDYYMDDYIGMGFWSYFDPTHVYYHDLGYDDALRSEEMEYEYESERGDSEADANWDTPPPSAEEVLTERLRYDEFWRKAGFILPGGS